MPLETPGGEGEIRGELEGAPARLEAPGKGLPWLELQLVRLRFGWARRRRSRGEFTNLFSSERERVIELASACDHQRINVRVLIDRVRGLEDSSRFWSVAMTLDHLRIVNIAFAGILRSLGRGIVPEGEVSTADVKPDDSQLADGPGVLRGFERSCDLFLRASEKASESDPQARFPHPWFGGLGIRGWHALGAVHLGIHRVQIERILDGLGPD